MEECLKLVLRDRDKAVYVLFSLVLLPAKTNPVLKKGYNKKNLVSPPSSSSNKIVLILLTEVIILYVELSVIHVWEMSFQGLISRLLGGGRSLSP